MHTKPVPQNKMYQTMQIQFLTILDRNHHIHTVESNQFGDIGHEYECGCSTEKAQNLTTLVVFCDCGSDTYAHPQHKIHMLLKVPNRTDVEYLV